MRSINFWMKAWVIAAAVQMAASSGAAGDEDKPLRAGQDAVRNINSLLGATVHNQQNVVLGRLDNVAFNRQGELRYAIVATGGAFGFGEDHIAASWPQLEVDWRKQIVSLDLERDRLKAAPRVKKEEGYRQLEDPIWLAEFGDFYQIGADLDPAQGEFKAKAEVGFSVDVKPDDESGESPSRYDALPQVALADQILGAPVRSDERQIAEVEDIVVGENDKIAFLILGRGGFIEIGETMYAVPWDQFKVQRTDGKFRLDAHFSLAQLKRAPELGGRLTRLADEEFVGRVRDAFPPDEKE